MMSPLRSLSRLLAAGGLFVAAGLPAAHAQQPRKATPAAPPRAVAVAPARPATPAAPARPGVPASSGSRLFEVRRVVPDDSTGGDARSYKDPVTGEYSTIYLDRTPLIDQTALESAKVVVINVTIRGNGAPTPSGPQGHIYLKLNEASARRFGQLTGQMLKGRLAMLINGRLIAAPVLTEPIFDKLDLTGAYSIPEARDMVNRINAVVAPGTPLSK